MDGAVTLLNNDMILMVLIELLVVVAHGITFRVSSWRFWVAVGGGRSLGRFMIAYVDRVL